MAFVESLALPDQRASALEVAIVHRVDTEAMKQHSPAVCVAELIDDREAPPVELERQLVSLRIRLRPELVQQPSRPLNVREEESDRAAR